MESDTVKTDWTFVLRLEVAGEAFLPFFGTREATALRAVCTELPHCRNDCGGVDV